MTHRRALAGARTRTRAAAVAALLLCASAEPSRAQAAPEPGRTATAFRFERRLVPSGSYLGRVVDAVIQREFPDLAAEMKRRSESVGGYARRYGISTELAQTILDAARDEGIDAELAFRLVRTESRFRVRAKGPSGALGLVQLMPSTARSIDRTADTEAEILDPRRNLRLGLRYLRGMIERYDGDVRLGLLAYNRGELAVDRALRSGRNPENGYSHRVLGTTSAAPYRGPGLAPPTPTN